MFVVFVWREYFVRRGVLALGGKRRDCRELSLRNVGVAPVVIDDLLMDGESLIGGLRAPFHAECDARRLPKPPVMCAYGFKATGTGMLGAGEEIVLFRLDDATTFPVFDEFFAGRTIAVPYHQTSWPPRASTATMRLVW